jgi:sugar phosphate permease
MLGQIGPYVSPRNDDMTTLDKAMNWRPSPPFFYGWLVLGVCALGAFVATSIAGVVLGGIQGLIVEDTGWKRSTVGLAAAVGVWGSGLVAPWLGQLADRYGPRLLMPLGTLLLGLSLLALGGAHSIWLFFLLAVLARAISQPLLIGVVPRTVAVHFFRRKRNTALACIGMFRPLSAAILIQLIAATALAYDWRVAFQCIGMLSLLFTLPMLLIIRRRPEDIGLLPDGKHGISRICAKRDREPTTGSVPNTHGWTARQALRTQTFWLIAITTFLSVTSEAAIGFNMVPYLHEKANLSTVQAARILSLSTLLAITSLAWGYVADKFTPRRCMIGAMLCGTGMVLSLLTVRSLLPAYLCGITWGILSSAQVLIYMLLAQYFGASSYGAITGVLRPFEAGGLGLGQSLGAILYDVTGSYSGLLIVALGAYLLAALLMFLVCAPAAPNLATRSDARSP